MASTSAWPLEHSCALGATIADFSIGGFGPFGDFGAEDQCKIRWIGVVELPTKMTKVSRRSGLFKDSDIDGHQVCGQVPGHRSGERRSSLSPSRDPRCLRPVLPLDPHGPSATSSSLASSPRGLRAPGSTFVSACTLCSRMCASVLAMLEYPAAPPCPVAAGAEQEAGHWHWGPAGSHGGQNAAQFGGWALHDGGAGVVGQPGGGCLGLH